MNDDYNGHYTLTLSHYFCLYLLFSIMYSAFQIFIDNYFVILYVVVLTLFSHLSSTIEVIVEIPYSIRKFEYQFSKDPYFEVLCFKKFSFQSVYMNIYVKLGIC